MKKKIVIALTLVICMLNFVFTYAAPSTAIPPENSTLLQSMSADVTGDGQKDTIALYGQKMDEESPYYMHIFLVVNDTPIALPQDSDGGYEPKFVLKDFNGDKVPDIFISAATGGSGGIMYYHIYSLKDGNAELLFNPSTEGAITVKGDFQPQYKVSLTVEQIKKTFTLDMSSRKDIYDEMNVYNNGELLQQVDVNIDYYARLTPVDTNSDGVYELQGIQAVWGAAHVDTLALIKSTWKWADGQWKYTSVQITKLN